MDAVKKPRGGEDDEMRDADPGDGLLQVLLGPAISGRAPGKGSDVAGRQDGLLWYKDAGQLVTGDFSMAVVQANQLLEDQSQVESGPLSLAEPGPQGTFVGVYDGHGGPETSRFINDHLFNHLRSKTLGFLIFFSVLDALTVMMQ